MTIQDGNSEKPAAGGAMVVVVGIVDEKITRKRPRGGEDEFNSSVIIPTEDENLAHTLVMLRHGGGDIFLTSNDDVSEEIITKSNKCFKCDVCGKDFPSYQALGGHKASHRQKSLQLVVSTADDYAKKPTAAADDALIESAKASDKKAHVCPKCGKSFTKGQSLGGHMRLHYDGTKSCKSGGGITNKCSGRESNCSILSSVITPCSVSQESGCGGGNYIGTSRKEEEEGEGQEIGLDLELRLGREIQVNQQKPKKKPRFSLTLSLDI